MATLDRVKTIGHIVFFLIIYCSLTVNAFNSDNFNGLEFLGISGNFGFQFYKNLPSESVILLPANNSDKGLGYQVLTNGTSETECLSQLRAVKNGLLQKDLWSIKVIDAWGKFPSGVLYGHLLEMGNFDECLSIRQTIPSTLSNIRGKYCLADVPDTQMATAASSPQKLALKIGICFPAACRAEQIDSLLKDMQAQGFLDLTGALSRGTPLVKENSCSTADSPKFEPIDWAAVSVLVVITALIISSTFYDYLAAHRRKPLNAFLVSFSLRFNLRELFRLSAGRNAPHEIPCLYGIRSMSIIWVIFGHSFLMTILSPNINSIDITEWARTPFSMFLQMGTVSVDTFFFLSGFLLITVAMRQMERTEGRLNVPLMYLHRYLRLTPVLAVAVLLFMSLYRYMGDGPLWHNFTSSNKFCTETWWATLLYIQNYAAAGKMCLGHSWYLAVDTQLYLISPLILMSIWKWKRKGVAAILVIGLLLFVCLFSIIVVNGYSVFNPEGNLGADNDEMRHIYYSTHARALPWIIGIIFGYFVHRRGGRPNKLSSISIFFGWFFSLALIFIVLFALYHKTQPDATPLTPLGGAFYLSLSRIAWPLALSWVVFACINGNAGPVNRFLSWSPWQPLSKLSYCMYIWHLVVESINAGRTKTNTHFSNYDAILRFWGDFGSTILVSLVMYLAVESPLANIEKNTFFKKKRTSHPNTSSAIPRTSQENLCDK